MPKAFIHEPWRMGPEEQQAAGCRIGIDYPERIVDHLAAAKEARERIYAVRRTPAFREMADAIQARHGSRKSGLARRGSKTRPRTGKRRKAGDQRSLDL